MSTVPTAPTPVHTAYAVPIGNVCVALYSKNMLILRQTKNPPIQYVEATPVVSLALPRQEAKPTSNNPAIISRIQFMTLMFNARKGTTLRQGKVLQITEFNI